jgi:hypothetical protein
VSLPNPLQAVIMKHNRQQKSNPRQKHIYVYICKQVCTQTSMVWDTTSSYGKWQSHHDLSFLAENAKRNLSSWTWNMFPRNLLCIYMLLNFQIESSNERGDAPVATQGSTRQWSLSPPPDKIVCQPRAHRHSTCHTCLTSVKREISPNLKSNDILSGC